MKVLFLAVLPLFAAPPNLDRLLDPDREVRRRAVTALARGKTTTAELAEHLFHDDPRVAAGIAQALLERGDAAALGPLAVAAKHADADRRAGMAGVLASLALTHHETIERWVSVRILGTSAVQRSLRHEVLRRLARIRGWADLDRPEPYRAFFDAGSSVARILRSVADDPEQPAAMRCHALAALARMNGRVERWRALKLLDDGFPKVRVCAARVLWYVGRKRDFQKVVDRLDREERPDTALLDWAVHLIPWVSSIGKQAERELARRLRGDDVADAVAAAMALKKLKVEGASRLVDARASAFLSRRGQAAGAGLPAALLHLRAGPLSERVQERMRQSPHPLVRAAVDHDRDRVLPTIRPFLDPEKSWRDKDRVRAQVCEELLRSHAAPWSDWATLAGSLLQSPRHGLRRSGARLLTQAPREYRERLKDQVRPLLRAKRESVRLNAAQVLFDLESRQALDVVIQAIYDGQRTAVRSAGALLHRMRPEWPRPVLKDGPAAWRKTARALRALWHAEER